MGKCVHCGTSRIFRPTSNHGLCRDCEGAVKKRFETEKQRLKAALASAGELSNDHDQELHLRRAMESVRALYSCERFGCGPMKPDLRTVEASLAARVMAIRVERQKGGVKQRPAAAPSAPEERAWNRKEGERRRSERTAEALPVRVGKGIRALATDTSAGGMCVHSPVFQSPGTRVDLVLHLPRGPVATEGVVRWARPVGREDREQGPAVLGLEFSAPLACLVTGAR